MAFLYIECVFRNCTFRRRFTLWHWEMHKWNSWRTERDTKSTDEITWMWCGWQAILSESHENIFQSTVMCNAMYLTYVYVHIQVVRPLYYTVYVLYVKRSTHAWRGQKGITILLYIGIATIYYFRKHIPHLYGFEQKYSHKTHSTTHVCTMKNGYVAEEVSYYNRWRTYSPSIYNTSIAQTTLWLVHHNARFHCSVVLL